VDVIVDVFVLVCVLDGVGVNSDVPVVVAVLVWVTVLDDV